jgi:hypothetical protein
VLTLLAAVAAASLVPSFVAHGRIQGVRSPAVGNSGATSSFKLPSIPQFQAQSPLQDGMIAQEEITPNAHVGLGLAPMLGRNIRSVRIEQELVPTRNPGVTFVVKFPG